MRFASHPYTSHAGILPRWQNRPTLLQHLVLRGFSAVHCTLHMQVPRPDGKPDLLGLKVLDEPCAHQSDPSVLMLQLRQTSKQVSLRCLCVAAFHRVSVHRSSAAIGRHAAAAVA